MTIDGSEGILESTWNDGVFLYCADFNTEDRYLDLYYFRSNTDASGSVYIYRYDGRDVSLYTSFGIEGTRFAYDGAGTVYFETCPADLFEDADETGLVTVSYDYDNNVFEIYHSEPE